MAKPFYIKIEGGVEEAKDLSTELFNLGAEAAGFTSLYPVSKDFYNNLNKQVEKEEKDANSTS